MPSEARIWKIKDHDQLIEIKQSKLNLEKRIETWLEQDISILSNDLLVIGRQEETAFGGYIDLLCLDRKGDAIVVELKRDKTPRDISAQTLDYASWVKDLSHERITEIADKYLKEKGPLETAFKQKFGEELPDILNQEHSMIIVASEIDSGTERIVNYLSDTYGVDINGVTFQYFKDDKDDELIARVFLIPPSEVEYKTQTKTATKRKMKWNEELFFNSIEKDSGLIAKQVAEKIFSWANQNELIRIWWGEGKIYGSFVPVVDYKGISNQLFAVWTNGYIEIYFQYYDYKPPFNDIERRKILLTKLNEIKGIDIPIESLSRRPTIRLSLFKDENLLNQFLEVFNWFIDEIKNYEE